MKSLPPGVAAYKKTAIFTEDTVPAGLTRRHDTKAGVWAVITVISGELRYDIPSAGETHVLAPGRPGVVEPEVPHFVTPLGPVAFFVEFYR